MKISICVNVDSRDGFNELQTEAGSQFDGCRSVDFMLDGIKNKQKFFDGYEYETIVFIDEHNHIPESVLSELREIADSVVIRKHTDEPNFNDFNYYSCLAMARGDIIAKFDADTAAFAQSKEQVDYLIALLDTYKFVSYPSRNSPKETIDDGYNYMWVSTRFFLCKRDTLDFTEMIKAQRGYEYYIETYKPSRVNHWAEHIISLVHGNDVYYPPFDLNRYAIFCWRSYEKYTLRRLNLLDYGQVKDFIHSRGGVHYPCEVNC